MKKLELNEIMPGKKQPRLFEFMSNYDSDGLNHNELSEPLMDADTERLFERVLFECNLKPLFERVLKEAGGLTNNTVNFYDKRRRIRELNKQYDEEIVEENTPQNAKTPDDIFSEIMTGLGKLYLSIEKLSTLSEKSEIEGETLRESDQGDALRAQIEQYKEYVQNRINELKPRAKSNFNTSVSSQRTRIINRYSRNINDIKNDIMSEDAIQANLVIKPPESNMIYRQCQSYINLIRDLNKILRTHNKYFEKLGRTEQIIDLA